MLILWFFIILCACSVALFFAIFFRVEIFYRVKKFYYLFDGIWQFLKRVWYNSKAVFVPSELEQAYFNAVLTKRIFWFLLFVRLLLTLAVIGVTIYLFFFILKFKLVILAILRLVWYGLEYLYLFVSGG